MHYNQLWNYLLAYQPGPGETISTRFSPRLGLVGKQMVMMLMWWSYTIVSSYGTLEPEGWGLGGKYYRECSANEKSRKGVMHVM